MDKVAHLLKNIGVEPKIRPLDAFAPKNEHRTVKKASKEVAKEAMIPSAGQGLLAAQKNLQSASQRLVKSQNIGVPKFNMPEPKPLNKIGFAQSQYSGDLSDGNSTKYTSYIPPFRSPSVKTAGPPSEDKGRAKEKTAYVPIPVRMSYPDDSFSGYGVGGAVGGAVLGGLLSAPLALKVKDPNIASILALSGTALGAGLGSEYMHRKGLEKWKQRRREERSSSREKRAGLFDTASEARAEVDSYKEPSLLRAALFGEFVHGDHKFPKHLQKRLVTERRDPRLYSNLRGMLTLEDSAARVAAHKKLDREKDHTIPSAMWEGITRGGIKMASMRDEMCKLNGLGDWLVKKLEESEAPSSYVGQVSQLSGLPEEDVRSYVKNIRPHRFAVPAEQFATDLKPVWSIKAEKYNPLQQQLTATAAGSPEEAAFLKQHGKSLDEHYNAWIGGQADLRKKYTGGDSLGMWANPEKLKVKTSNVISSLSQLTKTKKIGAPKVTAPPGPSIQQISKPVGFGTPIAGASKGAI